MQFNAYLFLLSQSISILTSSTKWRTITSSVHRIKYLHGNWLQINYDIHTIQNKHQEKAGHGVKRMTMFSYVCSNLFKKLPLLLNKPNVMSSHNSKKIQYRLTRTYKESCIQRLKQKVCPFNNKNLTNMTFKQHHQESYLVKQILE